MAWYPPAATDLFDMLATLPVFAAVMSSAPSAALWRVVGPAAVAFASDCAARSRRRLLKLVVDRPRPPASTEIEAFVTAASYRASYGPGRADGGTDRGDVRVDGRGGAVRFVAVLAGLAFAALVGLARIASGQHWPTDVVGGFALGVAWLTICLAVADRLEHRAERPPPAAA